MHPSSEKRFLRINLITLVTLFLLILAGGIVRSTGSGMGCPDWPKCFDQYIPPTDVSQLPADYQEKYVDIRVKKNERFARTLDLLGYGELAYRIRNDKSILEPEEFNVAKTWTEYINRVLGAVLGILFIACLIASIPYLKVRKSIFFWSLANLLLIGFQGWLGSIVVSTNLLAWVVTVHMLVAIAILAILIYTYWLARGLNDRSVEQHGTMLRIIAFFAVFLTVIQITLGTDVRESVDAIASAMNKVNRSAWVAKVGFNFEAHRDLAIFVMVVNVGLFFWIRRNYDIKAYQFIFCKYVLLLIILQVLTGFILSYFGLPPFAQALHILLATMLFGCQFYLFLLLNPSDFRQDTRNHITT